MRPLFTLETDKISTEIPAVGAGKLQIQVEAGQEVKIGQVVALLDESIKAPAQARNHSGPKPSPAAGAMLFPSQQESNETLSPAARRIVEEEKVNPAEVTGTGKRGQVTKSDLVQYLESKRTSPSPVPPGDPAACLRPTRPVRGRVPPRRAGRISSSDYPAKNEPVAEENCRPTGVGSAERRDVDHFQRVRHVRRDAAAIAIPGNLPEAAWRQAWLHVLFY